VLVVAVLVMVPVMVVLQESRQGGVGESRGKNDIVDR
jgi:preprotein translocase subunit SecG